MERKEFKITVNGEATYIKYKFNAAVRFTESFAGDAARAEGATYRLVETETVKDEYKNGVKGLRVWEGDNGNTLTFNIERVK